MSETPPPLRNPSDQMTRTHGVDLPPTPEQLSRESTMPPVQIDGYRMLHEISRGGQAVVYCAQFLKTGRRVAVKIMREGPLATESSRARFNREAQILASLNHPNIVTILDRGRTKDGSEYFAMDFIEGQSLDDGTWKLPKYMERVQPNPSAPLQLFLKICDAINAAHLRGIVHRDLKPSNIRLDERGEPHVLDFGLARGSMSEELPNSSEPVTITGQFLGSLPWASPEQAEGIGQKIDMRSDVYSLGVILYQLVTGGTFPYQVVGSMRDVLNNIITATPPAPSQIMSERESREVARRIKRVVPSDKRVNSALDAIILKALAKRRDDRYQNAGELARDIEAYLAGRPLQASGVVPVAKQSSFVLPAIIAAAIIAIGIIVWATIPSRSRDVTTAPASGANESVTRIPSAITSSSLRQEYQDMETILNRFMPITNYIRVNAPSRFAIWRAAADKGDAVGEFLVARCYEYGESVERNINEGNRYMRLAADKKLPIAMCVLGIRYRASLPPAQDYAEAMKWYTLAADAGSTRAKIDLGIMYSQGLGTPVNTQLALQLLQEAIDSGAPGAYAIMGDIYRTPGNGVTDLSKAVAMYKRGADVGAPYGSLWLGRLYAAGNGVPKDSTEAMRLLLRAEADGMSPAAETIGDLHLAGSGVKQDSAEAARWYQKAANNNIIPAMRKLAMLYAQGDGLPYDFDQATRWHTKAAAAGDAESRKWLAENAATKPEK